MEVAVSNLNHIGLRHRHPFLQFFKPDVHEWALTPNNEGTVNLTKIRSFSGRNQLEPGPRISNIAVIGVSEIAMKSLNLTIPMRGFKSPDQAQQFLHVHGVIQNLFRLSRHRLKSVHHRMLRERSFNVWATVTAA